MSTKAELSEQLNEIIPIEKELDFSKMKKEDLVVLKEAFSSPKKLVREILMSKGEETLDNVIMEIDSMVEESEGSEIGKGGILKRVKDRLLSD